jgi:phosphoribosylaminoimidazole-succinocarboxamide synthase
MNYPNVIEETAFVFKNQTNIYHGKVRDVYTLSDGRLLMIATDRISAFDHILPRAIPFKGQVLNQIAAFMLQQTRDICPNWLTQTPDPNVAIGLRCEPIKIEVVVRGYLTGHAWRTYAEGKRTLCGVRMKNGMKENDAFPKPIITPTTKADAGHDEDISKKNIIKNNLVSLEDYEKMEQIALQLFARGQALAKARGLILVDTKYEFGKIDNQIVLMDEIHTPDSSRYFYADTYETLQAEGKKQRQLSKEFVREWLIERNFQGKMGQIMPDMPDDFVALVSERYIELFERITGTSFQKPTENQNPLERIKGNLTKIQLF